MTTSSADQDTPGQLGEFVVVGVLGTGGTGVVLDARWGHREVALKVLHPQVVPTVRVRHQFLDEARRLQDISHKGVVKVLAVGELPDGRPYLAMEKLAGPTLATRLAAGPLPVAQALALFEQLANAVQALHDGGLVHRDLKPENVVLVGDAHAVLLDFGIAKELAAPASTTTQDGGVRGTPAYMAPERFFGQPASVATDVYELAVTLYAMLAGRLPWADCGDPEVRLNPRSLLEQDVRIPDAVDVEIRRALSTRAQNRPASVRELAAAVLQGAGLPPGAPPRTTTQVPMGDAARGPAWFEQRATPGSDRGQTPLAWAPTARVEAKPTGARPARRRWIPVAVIGVAAVAGVVGWIAWRGGDHDAPPPPPLPLAGSGSGSAVAGSDVAAVMAGAERKPDPWNPPPPAPPKAIADLRREMIAAIGKLPADTRSVIALGVAEMHADPNLGKILDTAARRPEVQILLGHSDQCQLGLSDIEWIVFGFGRAGVARQGEMLIRGDWTHEQIESCLAAIAAGKRRVDAATGMVEIAGDRATYWVGHDGPITIVSTRDRATAAQVAALVHRTDGPEGAIDTLLATIDPDSTMVVAIDADKDARIKELGPIPPGADVAIWARVDQGLRGRILGRFRSARDAGKAEAIVRTKLAELTKQGGDLVGRFDVSRQDKDVILEARVTELTLGLAAGALIERK